MGYELCHLAYIVLCVILSLTLPISRMNCPNLKRTVLPTRENVQTLAQFCPNINRVLSSFSRHPSFGSSHGFKEDDRTWNGSVDIPANCDGAERGDGEIKNRRDYAS